MASWTEITRLPAPLRSQVVANLRLAITEGVFHPGERLVERMLAARLQVSRPSLREAVRQLESEGLVEVQANRGVVVRTLSREELLDIYDLRAVSEGLCARYFAERGTNEDIRTLEARLSELETALTNGQRAPIIVSKTAYYEAFVAGSHSELIKTQVRQLNARVSYLWASSLDRPGRVLAGEAEMRKLYRAIKSRDAEAAFEAAQVYVQHAKETVLRVFEARAPSIKAVAKAAAKGGGKLGRR